MNVTTKRIFLYILGLFLLSLGVSFSIQANLGVSPVSSLAYAFSLTLGLSIGLMTIVTNFLFIMVQVLLTKRFKLKESLQQLMVTFLFGFFIDFSLYVLRLLPSPHTAALQWSFLFISLLLMAIGLFGYFRAKFTLMPYDALTHVIAKRFNLNLSKAKISGDLINVAGSGFICLIFIHSWGAVGLGTIAAAFMIGKLLGWLTELYNRSKHRLATFNE